MAMLYEVGKQEHAIVVYSTAHPLLVVQFVTCPADDGQSDSSDPVTTAAAPSGPPRQSSAINFNAALGNWALPARPSTAGNLLPPTSTAAARAASAFVKQQAGAKPSSVKVTHLMAGAVAYQQDLRPRSSDGILQRITVDRGPATGVSTID